MRIFRISSWEGQAGGAQLYIKTVNSFLEQKGHKTHTINIVTEKPDPSLVMGESIIVGNSFFDMVKLNSRVNNEFLDHLFEQYLRFSPDVVTVHSYGSPFFQIGEFLKRLDVPIIFNAHDSLLVCPINTLTKPGNIRCEGGVELRCFFTGCKVGLKLGFDLLKKEYFERTLLNRIGAFICPSRSLANYLHSFGYRPAIHLPSFVSDPECVPENVIGKKIVIGYIGRLEKWKGVQYLLKAFNEVSRLIDNVELMIAGKGPYEVELRKLTFDLGIQSQVVFLGNISGKRKEEFYAKSNIIVIPSSSWENHPLTAIEAQLRERPVVGTDFGGIKEIIEDKKTGFIVPFADYSALAKTILGLVNDPELIIELGKAGRKRAVTRFTPSPHIEMLLKVYGMVLRKETIDSPMEAANLA